MGSVHLLHIPSSLISSILRRRVLQPSWRDHASPLYDCLDNALRDEQASIRPWLEHQKRQNKNNSAVLAAERRFSDAMAELRSRNIHYDPRRPDAVMPMLNVIDSRHAHEAQNAWRNLRFMHKEVDGFDLFLDGAADTLRRNAARQLDVIRGAHALHLRFMAEAVRRALRWRVILRTMMIGVRWVQRALRTGNRG